MESLVSIIRCDTYDSEKLRPVVEAVFEDLGGLAAFVKRGDRVLIKPNLLKSSAPEEAVVTHPAMVEAVAGMIKDAGAIPFLGDSPPLESLKRVLSKSGYEPFMKRLGVEPVPFQEKVNLQCPESRLFRQLELAREVFEFDLVINVAKLKTHCQMMLTLAVKNLFGAIIGMNKASWHMRAGKDIDTFATVLVQIYEAINPALSLVDGILAMEGNGPNAGDPRPVGIIGGSTDPVALDATFCRIVGFKTEDLRTSVIGQKLGMGVADEDRIRLAVDLPGGFPLQDFKPPASMTLTWNLSEGNLLRRFLENYAVTKAAIDPAQCEACGICRDHCPPGAIHEKDGAMVIDRSKCISCFCCHELCSQDAIRIVKPVLGKILTRIRL
jgi:uncharacterized protein (DUF362 family)/Pyruvate/2-oxoacid:ferredoxin oxidoreductase delta subunit